MKRKFLSLTVLMLLLCCSCGMALGQNETDLRRAPAKNGEGYLPVLTNDTVTFSIAVKVATYINDNEYDPWCLGAMSLPFTSKDSDTAIFNNKRYRSFYYNTVYLREDTLTGWIFRYYPYSDTEVVTCDMSLQEGDTFYFPSTPDTYTWYEELSGQGFVVVDSVTYSNGRKVIWFPPVDVDGSFFST